MGMKLINQNSHPEKDIATNTSIPWPYSDLSVLIQIGNKNSNACHPNVSSQSVDDVKENIDSTNKPNKNGSSCVMRYNQWYEFTYSDYYQRDCYDYETIIQQSGDTNALLMFTMHHPFCCMSLLQLSILLYETNYKSEAITCLCRCLYVYESAMLLSFKQHKIYGCEDNDSASSNNNHATSTDTAIDIPLAFLHLPAIVGTNGFMNYDTKENLIFFQALQKLIQMSYMAG
jgi:Transcriptional repressor TCF25